MNMKKADISISNKDGVYFIKVEGRATFDCTPPLRSLSKNLELASFRSICVDLRNCGGMDSTFMGILAMLGLRAKKINASMTVFNASESSMSLLHGLGLKKLFSFSDGDMTAPSDASISSEPSRDDNDRIAGAQTVLEAHKALMDVDQQNVKKFEKVVDLVQKDLDKLTDSES